MWTSDNKWTSVGHPVQSEYEWLPGSSALPMLAKLAYGSKWWKTRISIFFIRIWPNQLDQGSLHEPIFQ